MRTECRRLGCDFVDLTDALRRRAAIDNRDVYHTIIDTHLAVGGNRVVSEQVVEWLRSRNIAAGQPPAPATPSH